MAAYGSSTEFSHSIGNFMEKSRRWIDFIGRIVKEELAFERRMIEARNYSKRAAAKNGEFALFGWRLDELYGLVEGEEFEFEDRDSESRRKASMRTEERNPEISMIIRKNDMGHHREFHGITVNCRMPEFFYGVKTAYYIEGDMLCRLQEDFQKKIRTIAQFCREGELRDRKSVV